MNNGVVRLGPDRIFARTKTASMAIINCTPDSFSGDGVLDISHILDTARRAVAAGACILDVGAESTRPGARPVTLAEERARLLPAITALIAALPQIPISVDTTKAELFRDAHARGATILNSVAGLPDALLEAATATQATIVITDPGGKDGGGVEAICARLRSAASRAAAAGLSGAQIVLDPGFGFGKTPDENLAILRNLTAFTALEYPTLLGASRKSTLGRLVGGPASERDYATAAATALAAAARIDFVRVHNVVAAEQTLAVANAVARGWRPADWGDA